MKKQLTRPLGALVVVLAMAFTLVGCGNSEKEEQLQAQIQKQINTLDDQVQGMEEHQASMRAMLTEMRGSLDAMQTELETEAPKIKNTQLLIGSLRELTRDGFGPSAAEETLANPSYSVLWVLFFFFLLWILYRLRSRAQN